MPPTLLEQYLIEILLSIILTFQIGAYKRNRNDIDQIREEMNSLGEITDRIVQRMYGFDEDPTSEGHLVETEERFSHIDDSLEEISSKIDNIDTKRREEHEKVRVRLESLISELSKEDSVDIGVEDIDS